MDDGITVTAAAEKKEETAAEESGKDEDKDKGGKIVIRSEAINESSIPKLDATLENVNSLVSSVEEELIPSARQSIENLDKLTGSEIRERIETLTENANIAVTAVESLAKSVEIEIKSVEFAQIGANLRSFLATAIRTSKTLDETLFNLNNGVDAVIEFIQYVDSDPSSFIQGKKKNKNDD